MGADRRFPVAAYVAVAAACFLLVGLAMAVGSSDGGWKQWDGGWYETIARDGYSYTPGRQSAVAFFPAYPLAMRALGGLTGGVVTAGIVVTVACGLGATVLFHRWCRARLSPDAARLAVLAFVLSPVAFYLTGAVYADALFIVAALGAFLLLERDRPVLAGLVGIVATAARPVGLALVIGLVVRAVERRGALRGRAAEPVGAVAESAPTRSSTITTTLERTVVPRVPRRVELRAIRWRDLAVVLAVLGVVAYCVYLAADFGEPFAFEKVAGAPGWDQPQEPDTWFKVHAGGSLLHADWAVRARIVFSAATTAGALALVPAVVRRFGWGYGTYAFLAVFLTAWATKDFTGMPRYVLAAFPCFAAAGDLLSSRPRLAPAVLGASGVLLAILTFQYGRGAYIS